MGVSFSILDFLPDQDILTLQQTSKLFYNRTIPRYRVSWRVNRYFYNKKIVNGILEKLEQSDHKYLIDAFLKHKNDKILKPYC